MPGGYGRNSFVGWAEESTWGTGVAATKFAELLNEAEKIIRERVPRPVVRGLFGAREANLYDQKQGAAGKFSIEANYVGMLKLFEHAFGDASGVVTVAEASIRWLTTFSLTQTPMAGKGLSLHVNTDVDNGATPQRRYNGFKIDKVTFNIDPKRNWQIDFEGAAKDHSDIAAVSFTPPAAAQYIAGHQTVVQLDTVVTKVDALTLSLQRNIDLDKRILGDKRIDEPVQDGQIHIEGEITKDAVAADMTKFRDGTLFRLDVIATGAALGAGNYKATLIALKCLVTDDPYNVTGPGLMKSRIPFMVLEPTSGQTLQLLIENNESAIG